jgi:hypothetical protein
MDSEILPKTLTLAHSLCQCPWSCGTVTTVEAEPRFPALSFALTVMVYVLPFLSVPEREAWRGIANALVDLEA